ncbi:MAG: dUTP diphosphatase [Clostridium sp.]|uniref:dUTP diphosphatase n=1 Tax=Clostridium sp. TaxID=1506 RepID=UPI003F2FC90F
MLVCDLFKVQKEIEEKISINQDLDSYKLRARKNLALHIHVSDLANETKCYTYLNDDDLEIDEAIILKKYISCFQLMLSIGLDNKYDCNLKNFAMVPSDYCLSDQFLNLYIDINDLIISKSEDHFETLCEDFLAIGLKLGFDENKIFEAFKEYAR